MIDNEFRTWAEPEFRQEPPLAIDARLAISRGRLMRRHRRMAAVAGAAAAAVAVAGVATGLTVGDRSAPLAASTAPSSPSRVSAPDAATSTAPLTTPTPSAPDVSETTAGVSPAGVAVADRFRSFLTDALPDGSAVSHVYVVGPPDTIQPFLPDFPHRVSLSLGRLGWISLLTGSSGLDRASVCEGAVSCTVEPRAEGGMVVVRSFTDPGAPGSRDDVVSVVLGSGHWVSATASNRLLDPQGVPGAVGTEKTAPLSRDALRAVALRAAAELPD